MSRYALCGGILAATLAALLTPEKGHANPIHYSNAHPEIQMFSYPAGSSNGPGSVRDRAATFGAFSGFDQQTQQPVFFPGTGLDPSRRGSFLIAGNTALEIPTGLDPSRYQINSLKITATVLGSLIFPPDFVLPYDNTLDDALSLTTGGGDDPGQPIELYGIGLQGDYETIDFGATANPDALQLGSPRWRQYQPGEVGYDPELSPSQQTLAPYQFFALDADGRDAENSVVGGYSATEPNGVTEQFTPSPFAIGKLYDEFGTELAPGTHFENGNTFVFEPNLADTRIVEYLQQSLAGGHLGFSISSLHQPAGHTGSVPYPDFYLDDLDIGNNPDGAAPTIEMDVTILDELLVGDFDEDGDVDGHDFLTWQRGDLQPPMSPDDLSNWQDNYGSTAVDAQATAIPEPATCFGLAVGLIAGCLYRTNRLISS